jgi:hypothetical protein
MLLHGIFPPLTTPFYPDGNVYFKKLEHNVERYSKTPAAGLVLLGSTGEAIMLSDEERREVLKVAREAAAPGKVLIAGTGIESGSETLRLTEYAAALGYDAALVRTPHFYKKADAAGEPAGLLSCCGGPVAAAGDDLQRPGLYGIRHSRRDSRGIGEPSQHYWDERVGRRRGENSKDGGSNPACKALSHRHRNF